MVLAGLCAAIIMFGFTINNVLAEAAVQSKDAADAPKPRNLDTIGEKLANPLSELWSLQMNFQMPHSSMTATSTPAIPNSAPAWFFNPSWPFPYLDKAKIHGG